MHDRKMNNDFEYEDLYPDWSIFEDPCSDWSYYPESVLPGQELSDQSECPRSDPRPRPCLLQQARGPGTGTRTWTWTCWC